MRHERVIVKRDERTTHNKTMCPWEIPIIEYMFGDGNVTRTDQFVEVPGAEYPDAVSEMDRLTRVYGSDPETKVPNAATVYGTARKGIRELAKAIEAAQEDEEGAKQKPKRKANQAQRAAAHALLN